MKILVLDPGGTTGWICFEIKYEFGLFHWKELIKDHFKFGQLGDNTEHHEALWQLLLKTQPDIIICEGFSNRDNEFAKQMSLEYIGIVKLYDIFATRCRLIIRPASNKEFSTDEKLSRLGLFITPKTKWRHALDAMRHFIQWACTDGAKEFPGLAIVILERLRPEPVETDA